ncbi:SulA-like leucine-rich domain-containing protein [Marinobacteraceae bacterium S3BR75-40.1]
MEQLSLTGEPTRQPPLTFELTTGTQRSSHSKETDFARTQPRTAPRGNVTEIILPSSQVENFQLLLPMLTQLNREERWLAWIDPPADLVQKWQQLHGIVPGQLLVLRSSPQHDALEMAERALAAGTCHAVVLWTGRLARAELRRLEQASESGDSHGVVLRER